MAILGMLPCFPLLSLNNHILHLQFLTLGSTLLLERFAVVTIGYNISIDTVSIIFYIVGESLFNNEAMLGTMSYLYVQ